MTRRSYMFFRAFKDSLPILMGYGTMGFAAGVVFAVKSGVSHPELWSLAIAVAGFSGTLHFVIGDWFAAGRSCVFVALMTLAISFRYALYGFALLGKWSGTGIARKLFLIGGLTDENFALEASCKLKKKADFVKYCTILTALNLAYWSTGTFAGALAGATLPLPSRGIEFVMAALFIAILTDQCRDLATGRRNG